jgi:hypothetical protein
MSIMLDDGTPDHGPALAAALRELRAPIRPPSQAAERAFDTLRKERRRRFGWPLAAAAALGALWLASRTPERARPVRFALRAPASARVTLTGDFNDWNAGQLPLEAHAGEWSVTLRLRPGRYRYAFVVDGTRWVADPHGAAAIDDDFGTPTSVVTVAR